MRIHAFGTNFEIAITRSLFKLERRSKAQNVGNLIVFLNDVIDYVTAETGTGVMR